MRKGEVDELPIGIVVFADSYEEALKKVASEFRGEIKSIPDTAGEGVHIRNKKKFEKITDFEPEDFDPYIVLDQINRFIG
jgi:hypothetical protein